MISDQALLTEYVQLQEEHRKTLQRLLETTQELSERQNERQRILDVITRYFESIKKLPVPTDVRLGMISLIEDIVACFSK